MYIRTKDGVYEVSEKTKYAQYSIRGMTMVKNADFQYISNENILKQSETIEELCDEFIDEEQHYIIQNKEIIREIPNNQTLKNHTIYGAIYTDKGLIYVAKMNDEGKLVLI